MYVLFMSKDGRMHFERMLKMEETENRQWHMITEYSDVLFNVKENNMSNILSVLAKSGPVVNLHRMQMAGVLAIQL